MTEKTEDVEALTWDKALARLVNAAADMADRDYSNSDLQRFRGEVRGEIRTLRERLEEKENNLREWRDAALANKKAARKRLRKLHAARRRADRLEEAVGVLRDRAHKAGNSLAFVLGRVQRVQDENEIEGPPLSDAYDEASEAYTQVCHVTRSLRALDSREDEGGAEHAGTVDDWSVICACGHERDQHDHGHYACISDGCKCQAFAESEFGLTGDDLTDAANCVARLAGDEIPLEEGLALADRLRPVHGEDEGECPDCGAIRWVNMQRESHVNHRESCPRDPAHADEPEGDCDHHDTYWASGRLWCSLCGRSIVPDPSNPGKPWEDKRPGPAAHADEPADRDGEFVTGLSRADEPEGDGLFTCPECGERTTRDRDGLCVMCGADLTDEPEGDEGRMKRLALYYERRFDRLWRWKRRASSLLGKLLEDIQGGRTDSVVDCPCSRVARRQDEIVDLLSALDSREDEGEGVDCICDEAPIVGGQATTLDACPKHGRCADCGHYAYNHGEGFGPEACDEFQPPAHTDEPEGDAPGVTGWTQFYDYEAEIEGGDTLAIHTDGHKDGGFGVSDPDVLRDLRDMIDQILSPTDEPEGEEDNPFGASDEELENAFGGPRPEEGRSNRVRPAPTDKPEEDECINCGRTRGLERRRSEASGGFYYYLCDLCYADEPVSREGEAYAVQEHLPVGDRVHRAACDKMHGHSPPGCCSPECWCQQDDAEWAWQVIGCEVSREEAERHAYGNRRRVVPLHATHANARSEGENDEQT